MSEEKEFVAKMGQLAESTMLFATLSVGYRLGLIQKLVGFGETPKTSDEIAAALGLRERYVREWLKAVVVAKVVEADASGTQFWLPKARVEALLTPWNINFFNFFPSLAAVYPQLLECFKPTGPTGLPYSAYPTFCESFPSTMAKVFRQNFVSNFLPTVPDNFCAKMASGLECLEIACGFGGSTIAMAKAYPNSHLIGVDFAEDMVEVGRKEAAKEGLTNVEFIYLDATKLPSEWAEKFDFVTIVDSLHDMRSPREALREIFRVLKVGGIFSLVDVGLHTNPMENRQITSASTICSLSVFHCLPVSMYSDGEGLGNNWGMEAAQTYLVDAGFNRIQIFPDVKGLGLAKFHAYCRK